MTRTLTDDCLSLGGKLPTVKPLSAQLSRLLYDARWRQLAPVSPPVRHLSAQPPSAAPLYRVTLSAPSGPIELMLQSDEFPEFEVAEAAAAGASLRAMASMALLEPWLGPLDALGLSDIQGLEITAVALAHDEPLEWNTVLWRDGRQLNVCVTQISESAAQAVRRKLRSLRTERHLRCHLRTPGTVRIATIGLPSRQLRSLALGDVVITPRHTPANEGQLARVCIGDTCAQHMSFNGVLQEQSITIQGKTCMNEADTDTSADRPSAGTAAEPLDDLEIPVRFELDTVALALADLEALRPGYVLELAVPLSRASVRLVAFGQTIGHAELVAVGDTLGARITHLAAMYEQPATH
jgi:type III secretion protein Q